MATCSRIPAWKIPCSEEPDRLQSMGLQRVTNRHKHLNFFFSGIYLFIGWVLVVTLGIFVATYRLFSCGINGAQLGPSKLDDPLKKKCIYLAVLGLSCCSQNLCSSLEHAESFVAACGI